jgi:sugar lactone lactonase YvrE
MGSPTTARPGFSIRATAHRERALPVLVLLAILTGCGGGGYGGGGGGGGGGYKPTITQQPQSMTVNAGQSATFTVVATGATSYQWQKAGHNISGAVSSSYMLASTTSQNNGDSYQVVVSNADGSVTSSAAALRVTGVSVIAGQPGGMGYADGPAGQARFWGPVALAFDGSGNLFVADYNAIRKIDTSGTVSTVVGSPRDCAAAAGTGSAARLCYPYSLAIDGSGNIFAGDNDGVVWEIAAGGATTTQVGSASCPFGVTTLGGALYIADNCAGAVIKNQGGSQSVYASLGVSPVGISSDGVQTLYVASDTVVQSVTPGSPATVTNIAGTLNMPGTGNGTGAAARFGCAQFPYPVNINIATRFNGAFGIATTGAGLSYVSDYCNHTVRSVDSAGKVSAFAGTPGTAGTADGAGAAAEFWLPAGTALDATGNVYVADYGNALIRKITPAGVVSTYAGMTPHFGSSDGAGAAASFRYPYGIAADGAGNLYVTDGNHTIRKITPAGVVSTLAGQAGAFGSADGTGSTARFFMPKGIAADGNGNLYVADSGNYTVRKVTAAGAVSTLAGSAGVKGFQDGTGSGALFTALIGIAVDATNNVWVSDGARVRKITPAGVVSTLPASTPLAIGGITADAGGMLYLTTYRGVYSMTQAGALALIAGGGAFGAADGTGAAASFNFPAAIVKGGDGNLYVADQQNSTIRKVTLAGVVTTPVGTAVMPMGIAPGGLPAHLGSPRGLVLISSGPSVSLAIADEWESVILRVDLP